MRYDALEIGVVPGKTSMLNSISRTGGQFKEILRKYVKKFTYYLRYISLLLRVQGL